MKRYLDPKNDLVFKRVFGEHPHILRAFLNAVLPLSADEQIVSLEYLTPEQVPEIPLLIHPLVNVSCKGKLGIQFIVEIQIRWTTLFLRRGHITATDVCVPHLKRGEQHELTNPVFGLIIFKDIFLTDTERYYHHYKRVDVQDIKREIKGLQLVFIELPKFTQADPTDGKVEWLRYLRETGEQERAPEELGQVGAEMKEALELAEYAAYTSDELIVYDRYWDAVSTEKTLISGKLAEGREQGRKEGRQEGLEEALKMMIASGIAEDRARIILGLDP